MLQSRRESDADRKSVLCKLCKNGEPQAVERIGLGYPWGNNSLFWDDLIISPGNSGSGYLGLNGT